MRENAFLANKTFEAHRMSSANFFPEDFRLLLLPHLGSQLVFADFATILRLFIILLDKMSSVDAAACMRREESEGNNLIIVNVIHLKLWSLVSCIFAFLAITI